MGFSWNSIGGLIEKLPGGNEALGIINGIGNPIISVLSPLVSFGTSMLNSVMSMSQSLMKTFSSPIFMYLIVGGLAIGGIMIFRNGGNAPLPPQLANFLGK